MLCFSLKSSFALKKTFESEPEVKKKTEILRQLTEEDLLNGFDQWKTRMQWCVVAEGQYNGKVIEM